MNNDRLLHFSIAVVWLWSSMVGIAGLNGDSRSMLEHSWVSMPRIVVDALIITASGVAFGVGILLFKPHPKIYLLALSALLAMMATTTVLSPGIWLDPYGPMLKNLPIAAILIHLYRRTR